VCVRCEWVGVGELCG